jgi:hypothetical protein
MSPKIPDYDELQLRIEEGAQGFYRVLAVASDQSTARGDFRLPFDESALNEFVRHVGSPRRRTRGEAFASAELDAARLFGSDLFEALFSGPVRDVYHRARERADSEDKGLRVTLYLSDVPDLQHIPWEFLYERPMFLVHSIETPVVRSLDLERVRRPRKVKLPLRILGVDSRPRGTVPLDADQERTNVERALIALKADGVVELEWLERATLRELQRRLDRPDDFHVLHYIGHGAYNEQTRTGVLLLERQDGTAHQVTGEELGSVLHDKRTLRLAVLNACEGARASHRDPFSGVASSLVGCGIPAVVGMQFEITDNAAITLAEQLYASLAAGYPVDACLAQARRAVWTECNDTEFGTPVLFLRAADARLFNVKETSIRLRREETAQDVADFSGEADRHPEDGHADGAVDRPREAPRTLDRTTAGSSAIAKIGKNWSVNVIERDKRRVALRVKLDQAEHLIEFEWGWLKDVLRLNKEIIRTVYWNHTGGYTFTMSDGDKVRSARFTVVADGMTMTQASLKVSGRLLYRA